MKDPTNIIVLFHNGEGFDFHFIVKGQAKVCAEARKASRATSSTDDPPDLDDEGDEEYEEAGEEEEDANPLENCSPKVLANTKEKFMQVGIGNILFRDSMKFNKASLAKMIDALRAPYDKLSLIHI